GSAQASPSRRALASRRRERRDPVERRKRPVDLRCRPPLPRRRGRHARATRAQGCECRPRHRPRARWPCTGDSRRVGSPEVALVADPRVAVPRESDFRPGHTAFTPKTHRFPAFAAEAWAVVASLKNLRSFSSRSPEPADGPGTMLTAWRVWILAFALAAGAGAVVLRGGSSGRAEAGRRADAP